MNSPDKVRDQYEKWVYPLPKDDLEKDAQEGCYDLSDPTLFRRKLWPRPIEPEQPKILVAGCGSSQAAGLAFHNPDSEIVGIDISNASLAHSDYLKQKHRLHNLHLHQLGIQELEKLGQRFDLIISTGVLHHLPDPDAGLRHLKAVLQPHGVMSIMVYAWYRRFGVYMLQEAFRLLGIEQTDEGLAIVRETIRALPAWHHIRSFVPNPPDTKDIDAELVDIFLHSTDRAYTVPQVLQFATQNGLCFQDWLDRYEYALSAHIDPRLSLARNANQLKREEQWHLVELITQLLESHRFLLCHPERNENDYTVEFTDPRSDSWLSWIPHLRWPIDVQGANSWIRFGPHMRPRIEENAHRAPLLGIPATFRRHRHVFRLDEREAPLFRMVDGKATIAQIIEVCSADRQTAFHFFARMREWDHIVYQI